MSMPVRALPVVQSWDCHGCGTCCRDLDVPVTAAERARIEAQGWKDDPEIGDLPLFVRQDLRSGNYRLFRGERGCVFLNDQGRCRLHERHGVDAKPLACRLYPFVLVPLGDQWRVSLRFACPSAATSQGRPLPEHVPVLEPIAAALENADLVRGKPQPLPELQDGQPIAWEDLGRFHAALLALFRRGGEPLEQRWRRCLALAAVCRKARFEKVTGDRLREFLQVVAAAVEADVPADAARVPPPGWRGRMHFRQALAVLTARDRGALAGAALGSGWRRLLLAWRFLRGTGAVPRVNALVPDTTFERVELATGPLPAEALAVLERYYEVKLTALHFFGPAFHGLGLWEGLDSLALTLPAVLWLARVFEDRSREEAVTLAVQIVDENLGYEPLVAGRRFRAWVDALAAEDDLARLIAWYSR
jgi:lysine-N-methylase